MGQLLLQALVQSWGRAAAARKGREAPEMLGRLFLLGDLPSLLGQVGCRGTGTQATAGPKLGSGVHLLSPRGIEGVIRSQLGKQESRCLPPLASGGLRAPLLLERDSPTQGHPGTGCLVQGGFPPGTMGSTVPAPKGEEFGLRTSGHRRPQHTAG